MQVTERQLDLALSLCLKTRIFLTNEECKELGYKDATLFDIVPMSDQLNLALETIKNAILNKGE